MTEVLKAVIRVSGLVGKKLRSNGMLRSFANVCFPSVCLHCNAQINEQELWLCGSCFDKLSFMPEQHCPRCGYPTEESECGNCIENHYVFTQAKSVFLFDGPAKTLVHSLKYDGFTAIADWFANQMYMAVLKAMPMPELDYVTAIPLHRVKKRERGFNQSELIARALAAKLDKPYTNALLKRRSNTMSQTLLNGVSRRKNMKDAFLPGRKNPKGKSILIVDDVFTTGTTVNEAAIILNKQEAKTVYVLTVCHGL